MTAILYRNRELVQSEAFVRFENSLRDRGMELKVLPLDKLAA